MNASTECISPTAGVCVCKPGRLANTGAAFYAPFIPGINGAKLRICYKPINAQDIIESMNKTKGEIVIQPGANVWEHELVTAKALAAAGYNITFVKASTLPYEKSPDVLIDGEYWEIKAPEGSLMKRVEKNIRRALVQSCNVIFDCRRMKGLPDTAIERELRICAGCRVKKLHHLKFINRKGIVIDIK